MDFKDNYYEILGVSETATPEDIRKAYLRLAKKLHPDRFPDDPQKRKEAQEEFSKVTKAQDVLLASEQRQEYDTLRSLHKSREAGTNTPGTGTGGSNREEWALKHHQRACQLLSKKQFLEAETALKEALRLSPNKASFHATMAELNLARGWRTLAATSVQTALKLDPTNFEAKQTDLKIKSSANLAGDKQNAAKLASNIKKAQEEVPKKGLVDQLKELLTKKI